jgi:molybdopterin molybdotransferase
MESSAPMTYAKALELLGSVGRAALLSTEMIALELGLGRILSEDIYSPEQHPPWNCSAMDGFAVRSSSLLPFSAQSVHKILGTIAAGDATLKATEAQNSFDGVWEIMTGAPLPHDFDSVVRSEDSLILEDVEPGKRAVQFTVAVTPDKNVRQKGEDFFIGQKLFPQGHKLRASDLLCLATLGIAKISVRRKLRVGLVSTGNELIAISAGKNSEFVCFVFENRTSRAGRGSYGPRRRR